jgi:hypothetical protein
VNCWEKDYRYAVDFVSAMLDYAESVNPDHDSKEFSAALEQWISEKSEKFERNWNENYK